MIFNVSVADGFTCLIGPLPLQLCLVLTVMVSISVPLGVDGEPDEDAAKLYSLMLTTHAILCLQLLVSYFGDAHYLPFLQQCLKIATLIAQIYMIIKISSDWLFNRSRPTGNSQEWGTFTFWLYIEFCFFLSYIVTNAVFLSIRAIKESPYYLEAPGAGKNRTTDFLDANYILVGMISLMSSPAFVAFCIYKYSQFVSVIQQENTSQFLFLMGIQIFQAMAILVLSFTPSAIYMGNPTYNKYAPIVLYALQYVIFLGLPPLNSGLCAYVLWSHSNEDSVLVPWFTLVFFQGFAMCLWYLWNVHSIVQDVRNDREETDKVYREDEEALAKAVREEESQKMVEDVVTHLQASITATSNAAIDKQIEKLEKYIPRGNTGTNPDKLAAKISKLWTAHDTNGDLELDRAELKQFLTAFLDYFGVQPYLNEEQVNACFDEIDTNRDGRIKPDEMQKFAQNYVQLLLVAFKNVKEAQEELDPLNGDKEESNAVAAGDDSEASQ